MLPKAKRLATKDVASLTNGRSVFGTLLSLRFRQASVFKCSVSVSKKVAPRAVDRNRIRRRVYAAVEKASIKDALKVYMLIMPKKEAMTAPLVDIASEVAALMKKAGL